MSATKFFKVPFALSGDKTAIPDSTQPSGSVSYTEGFGEDYGLNYPTDPLARGIPRDQTNQLYFDITTNIQEYQTIGIPNFISTTDNGGTPYSYQKFAMALYDDGVNGPRPYQSLVNINTALPTDGTKWKLLDFLRPDRYVFTTSGSFIVPDNVTSILVSGVGAGGGGGGTGGVAPGGTDNASSGGGGGGGAAQYTLKQSVVVTPGETLTVTIGAAGTPGTAGTTAPTSGGTGGTGGNTILLRIATPLITLSGGQGGFGSSTPSTGIVGFPGAGGDMGGQPGGIAIFNTAPLPGVSSGNGGCGASTPFGTGGLGRVGLGSPNAGNDGQDGYGNGSGGGGACGAATGGGAGVRAGGAGGNGTSGLMIIEF